MLLKNAFIRLQANSALSFSIKVDIIRRVSIHQYRPMSITYELVRWLYRVSPPYDTPRQMTHNGKSACLVASTSWVTVIFLASYSKSYYLDL